jgi:DNA-binding transcriptional LysR family regulator
VGETIDQTKWMKTGASPKQARLVTMVGPTFLLTHLVAPHAQNALKNENLGLRLYDVSHAEMTSPSFKPYFELAVHADEIDWGKAWVSYPIGMVQWILCGRKNHPLGMKATEKEVAQFPFVMPTTLASDGFRLSKDGCPLPEKERVRQCEVRSGELGLRTIDGTDQLIFLPEIQAADLIKQGVLQSIEVQDWPLVRRTIYLTAHQDRMTHRHLMILLKSLEAGLARSYFLY